MTQWTHNIQGLALVENLAAADAIAAQIPNANHSALFSTGLKVRTVAGTTYVARAVNIAARSDAVAAATAMLGQGLPPALAAVRIVERGEGDSIVDWLATLGYAIMPGIG